MPASFARHLAEADFSFQLEVFGASAMGTLWALDDVEWYLFARWAVWHRWFLDPTLRHASHQISCPCEACSLVSHGPYLYLQRAILVHQSVLLLVDASHGQDCLRYHFGLFLAQNKCTFYRRMPIIDSK